MDPRLSVVLETLVRRRLLPAILALRSTDPPTQTQVPDAALQEQERIACQTLDLLLSLGFGEEDCLKCLRRLIQVIDGHGCAEAQTARDDRRHEHEVAPPTARSQTCPVQTTFHALRPAEYNRDSATEGSPT